MMTDERVLASEDVGQLSLSDTSLSSVVSMLSVVLVPGCKLSHNSKASSTSCTRLETSSSASSSALWAAWLARIASGDRGSSRLLAESSFPLVVADGCPSRAGPSLSARWFVVGDTLDTVVALLDEASLLACMARIALMILGRRLTAVDARPDSVDDVVAIDGDEAADRTRWLKPVIASWSRSGLDRRWIRSPAQRLA